MNRDQFKQYLSENIMILDGATGTELQKRGMPSGVCPEQWVIENPQTIIDIQRDYINAGSNAVYTCTFGANPIKLREFGLEDQVVKVNKQLAMLSREAVGDQGFVAGDLAPTGEYIQPVGILTFEEMVNIYKAQVKGLLQGGVDFFVIETMMNIQEARAALLAVKESCDLPICVSMTFEENGRTLTGTDPVTALITLQSLGADAVGCNCSTGPKAMIEVMKKMKPYAKIPLLAKPNAGLPKLAEGRTVFDMDQNTFGTYITDLVEAGANMIGGCCGTSPSYIGEIHEKSKYLKPIVSKGTQFSVLTSSRETLFISSDFPTMIIGERINPTGKKLLQEELKDGQFDLISDFALEQIEKGAHILDINVGMNSIDEKETMVKAVEHLTTLVHVPLCIDSSDPEVIEAALRVYPGRALVNSISLEEKKVKQLLPIAAKYGAMFILLPLSDQGLPKNLEEKHNIIEKVYRQATQYGYGKKDIIVDGLVMTVSSKQKAPMETLETIEWCTRVFGCHTVMGLSNVSFGLPERQWINTAFLAMAIGKGLTMAIANPSSELLMNIKYACDVLTSRDLNSEVYISEFGGKKIAKEETNSPEEETSIGKQAYHMVLKGERNAIIPLVKEAITKGVEPKELVDEYLIPAINRVGDLYEEQVYFLPQLIMSAETMKNAFQYLEPILQKNQEKNQKEKVKIILATVRGDIHDIGKNIVSLMLRNHGYEIIDLGKDVSKEEIIDAVRETGARIIGLSALMTTTMTYMKEVIASVHEAQLPCKIIIGGAVVTEEYAEEIGADGYAQDATSAVRRIKQWIE